MSHDTHHASEHQNPNEKSRVGLTSAFWFVLLLAVVFIAAVNFVGVMSKEPTHGHEAATHDASHGSTNQNEGPATSHEAGPAHGEATGHELQESAAPPATTDTAHHEDAAHH